MIEVGAARGFQALHRLVDGAEPDEHEHDHEYRVEAVVRGEPLPESGMLLDLDALHAALSACLDELDASDLDALPMFEGRATTVEIVSEHIWHHLRDQIGRSPPLQSLRVTVYESSDAWASVDRGLED
jgi:6-pyruvoyltetrahydropterin/6-carboxytetrahydropterin synthase